MKNETRIKLAAFIFGVVGSISSQLYLPSLPAIADYMHTSLGDVQLSISSYLLGFALLQLVFGPLSDRYGRKLIGLLGLLIAVFGCFGTLLANSIWQLIIWRMVQGGGISACFILMRAIMRDAFSGKELARGMSHISLAFVIAPAVAPIIGGYVQHYFGWHANLTLMTIYTFATFLLVWAFLPETNASISKRKFSAIMQQYINLLKNRNFMVNLLCASLSLGGTLAYIALSPLLYQQELGFSPALFGWITLSIAFTLLLCRTLNIWLINRWNLRTISWFSTLLMILGSVLLLGFGVANYLSFWTVLLPALTYVFGSGILLPNMMARALTPFSENIGSVAAVYGCGQMLISFLTTAIVSVFASHYQLVLALTLSIISVLCALILRHETDDTAH